MADRLPGKQLVEAPDVPAWAPTLLTSLAEHGLLHDAPVGSHLQNGVYWQSDFAADVRGNDDVVYEEGSFSSENKTIQHNIANTGAGFAFEITRLIELGFGSGGSPDEQVARAQRRFDAWESFDVERHVKAYLDAEATDITGAFSPKNAVARLFAAIAQEYQGSPFVLSGRGHSPHLFKDEVVELAGGVYAPGSGFGIGDTVSGEVYGVGTISIWRTPAIVTGVPTPTVNEFSAFVERSYYVVIDGPKFRVTSTFAETV